MRALALKICGGTVADRTQLQRGYEVIVAVDARVDGIDGVGINVVLVEHRERELMNPIPRGVIRAPFRVREVARKGHARCRDRHCSLQTSPDQKLISTSFTVVFILSTV
jgi:hypothetical protein